MTMAWYGYLRIAERWLRGYRVNQNHIQNAYDSVAYTYDIWQQRMHRHTERILEPLPETRSETDTCRVVDLACGTAHITRRLLQLLPAHPLEIIGVDLSPKMIEICQHSVTDKRARFVAADALPFLRNLPDGHLDAVYCGWGMVYLPAAQVVNEIHRALRPEGLTGIIMNRKGTLAGVEEAFIEVMTSHPSQIQRVMDIRFNMPSGLETFTSWFTRQGFDICHAGEGKQIVETGSIEEMWRWLMNSGALAGAQFVFKDIHAVQDALFTALAKRLRCEHGYAVQHAYVYGVFKRKALGDPCGPIG